jgi:hypothetical protein
VPPQIKGAIIVLGTKEQGILHTHFEEFGKKLDVTEIEAAIKKLKGAKLPEAEAAK